MRVTRIAGRADPLEALGRMLDMPSALLRTVLTIIAAELRARSLTIPKT